MLGSNLASDCSVLISSEEVNESCIIQRGFLNCMLNQSLLACVLNPNCSPAPALKHVNIFLWTLLTRISQSCPFFFLTCWVIILRQCFSILVTFDLSHGWKAAATLPELSDTWDPSAEDNMLSGSFTSFAFSKSQFYVFFSPSIPTSNPTPLSVSYGLTWQDLFFSQS